MSKGTEINSGYLDHVRALNRIPIGSSTTSSSLTTSRWSLRLKLRFHAFITEVCWPLIAVGGLITAALALEIWLRLYLFIRRSRPSQSTILALGSVDEFVEQYPFHLYPIVCKAFELAWLGSNIPNLTNQNASFVEIAIGEGTLSSRVFPTDAGVVGLDLSPYSLKKASEKPHVKQAIVCDCLNPPIRKGSFDVLLANNFLHHVTNKDQTLSKWSDIAEKAIFNENSPTWASGWPVPYMLRKIGRPDKAALAATEIERQSLQSLEPKVQLDAHVEKSYEVIQCTSYMSERTFFYSGVFSFIMRCYGPPTPPKLKALFLSRLLRWLVLPLTANLAKLLIQYDQHQDRSTDSFISYVCRSRNYVPIRTGNYLACPNCHRDLQTNECTGCGNVYSYTDGMLFLLPSKLVDLQQEYRHEVSSRIPKEHL
jgi:uncharacterized protein YbaR (Trm112 family)